VCQEYFERAEDGALREHSCGLVSGALRRGRSHPVSEDRVAAGYGRAGPSPRLGLACAVWSSSSLGQ